ncbi:helix-turn-helix transcriptional regulator [Bacillus sp. FJAT-49711]|uniref:AraC family transcriptional regulator n=1 Tax=Bacillus sp. FJAT-49711 TaxID=2833585 RepID=UPI001BC9FA33|nr:AraC family transcriptional regulator [Bacillus sp. FJAT-49711]MBS4218575.1 helix-turn-helix transcriptional regulator [Bacillus sp. FJAT-49711]
MRDELWENTNLLDHSFPINIFHNDTFETETLHLHWHEHYEIILLKSGETVFYINGNRIPAIAGDIIFINSGELHTALSEYPNHVQYDAIVFHSSLLGNELEGSLSQDIVSSYVKRNTKVANIINQDHPQYYTVKEAIVSLTEEFTKKDTGYQLAVRAYCQLIFMQLIRSFTVQQGDELQLDVLKKKAERFKALLLFIEENYSQKITVGKAASIVNLSPYHFCKVFKELTGSTFIQFINLHRIYEADKLLVNSIWSISEIAERVGFNSIYRFSKVYKNIKGYPPSNQRKMM